jgi:mannose-6-phosphate isomerase-like protein (cupin superfamily)
MTAFPTQTLPVAPDVIAPDGSEVRILCALSRGSMAHFTLPAGAVARAVVHRSVEEVWLFIGGRGEFWRKDASGEEIVPVGAGVSVAIFPGTHFQFRADAAEPLVAVGVTMPPWPGADEAMFVDGVWPATV